MKKLLSLFTALPLVAILMFNTFVFAGAGDIVIEGKYVEVPSNGMFYSASYFPDYNEADQAVVGDGRSTKDYIDAISTDSATLVFQHNSGAATTTYTFATDETIPSNINVVIEKGAILSDGGGSADLTINLFEAGEYKIFDWTGSGDVIFGTGAAVATYFEWFGAVGDGSTDDLTAIDKAIAATTKGGKIQLLNKVYNVTGSVVLDKNLTIQGTAMGSDTVAPRKYGSVIQGTGFAILSLTPSVVDRDHTILKDFSICASASSASNVGVLIGANDPAAPVANCVLENLYVRGYGDTGYGIYLKSGIKCVIQNSHIIDWTDGIRLEGGGGIGSNANSIISNKIRGNTNGVNILGASTPTWIAFNTIEGNNVGLLHASGYITVIGNHFENEAGVTPAQIKISAGFLVSYGNGFYQTGPLYRDIMITGGAPTVHSFGDLLQGGVTNNGNGNEAFKLALPTLYAGSAGSGIVRIETGISGSFSPAGALATPGDNSTTSYVGRYRKDGNMVTCIGNITFLKGTGTGTFTITGLPFTSANVGSLSTSVTLRLHRFGAANEVVHASIAPNTTVIDFYMVPLGTGVATLADDTDLDAVSVVIEFSVTYQIEE